MIYQKINCQLCQGLYTPEIWRNNFIKYQCQPCGVNIYLICELNDEQYMFSPCKVLLDNQYANYTIQVRVKVGE